MTLSCDAKQMYKRTYLEIWLLQAVVLVVHVSAPACRIKTMAAGATERAVCTWLGGSILASIGAFHEMWISRQEYNEFGASLIDRKCP